MAIRAHLLKGYGGASKMEHGKLRILLCNQVQQMVGLIAGGADRVQAKFVENSLAGRVQNAGINRFHLKIGP